MAPESKEAPIQADTTESSNPPAEADVVRDGSERLVVRPETLPSDEQRQRFRPEF